MADGAKKRKFARETSDGLAIRAKGLFLRLPAEIEDEKNIVAGLTGHAKLHTKGKRRKPLCRRVQRKKAREEKKAKKNTFFSNRSKKQILGSSEAERKGGENKEKQRPEKDRKKRKKKKKKTKAKLSPENAAAEGQKVLRDNTEDDKEIKRLEKLLKLKRKKQLPSSFEEDGLDYLLEVCEPLSKRFHLDEDNGMDYDDDNSGKEDLHRSEGVFGSGKAERNNDDSDDDDDGAAAADDGDDDYGDDGDGDGDNDAAAADDDDGDGDNDAAAAADDDDDGDDGDGDGDEDDDIGDAVSSDEENEESDGYLSSNQETAIEEGKTDTVAGSRNRRDSQDQIKGDKESARLEKQQDLGTKYIPPHLRRQDGSEAQKETLIRVKRQIKGLLNRLSESNIQSISGEIEEHFMHHSRNDMNQVLTDLILGASVAPTLMPEKLLMEHMMLLTVLHVNLGMEVGAFFLQTLAKKFDSLHGGVKYGEGKECFNVILLFAHLYNFKLIDCSLIYDIIRRLAENFTEHDIELLLFLLRSTGAEIRRDDPASLKEIILQIQAKAASVAETTNQSRVRFMLDIISALRNNNLRKIPGYDPSQVEHLRKVLRSVIRDSSRLANTQLKISLQDLLDADTKGRWWIVGSAWSGREADQVKSALHSSAHEEKSKLLEIARQQRMNTDVRKNIFCTIMSSEDYIDAFEKLLRLKLKDVQAREIVHVLIDCCLQEKTYNPFYSYLGQKLCEYNRSYQVTFQYTFWDKFKIIAELAQHSVANMAEMLAHLIATRALSLTILKAVNFAELEKPSIKFFRQFLLRLMLDYPEQKMRESFERIAPLQELAHLRQSLRMFIKHFIQKHKQTMKKEKNRQRNLLSRLEIVNTALHS